MTNELILNADTCDNIIKMMDSPDKGNFTVAAELIKNINLEENLPYILMIYKESKYEQRTEMFPEAVVNKLNTLCHHIKIESNQPITYQNIYDEIKTKKVSQESMEYFLEKFAARLQETMSTWGFSFIKDFKLKLIPIKHE